MIKFFKFLIAVVIFLFGLKSYAVINVAFTIDNNYPLYTMLTINSILLNNKSNSDYKFWIIENNVTDYNKEEMRNFVQKRGQKIEFIDIDNVLKGYNEYMYSNNQWANHITKIGIARIYLPEVLPKDVKKVLYLDGDVLVISDLKELYDTDISKYAAALAKNNMEFHIKPKDKRPCYYNSGVILINLDDWRKNNYTHQMEDYIAKNVLDFPDQDSINYVLRGKIKMLDQKWNNQVEDKGTLVWINNGGIIHYIGGYKPWHVPAYAYKKPLVALYYKYWNKCELKKYQISFSYVIKNCYFITIQTIIQKLKDMAKHIA